MPRLTLEQIRDRQNTIQENLTRFRETKISTEGFQHQKNMLTNMLYLLAENQNTNGSMSYNYLEEHLKQTSALCDELMNRPETANNAEKVDNYYSMLLYTQSLAERYLDYKKDPVVCTGSDLEKSRMESVRVVLSETRHNAEILGAAINERRKAQLFEPGDMLITNQLTHLTDLYNKMKETATFLHPHGKKFDNILKQFETTMQAARVAIANPNEADANIAYKNALSALQADTDAYLLYKKTNNDFGKTSTSRIQLAGRLKLMLQDAVPVITRHTAQVEERRAREWFSGMEGALKEKGIDLKNPISASSIMILNPRSNWTAFNDFEQLQAEIKTVPYKDSLAHVPTLDRMMQVALIPTDGNGKQLRPLGEYENVADWLLREIPDTTQNRSSYPKEHIVHLYRMAKANRLVLRTNKDAANDSEMYDRIAVTKAGTCVVDDAFKNLNGEGIYANEADYQRFNVTRENAQQIRGMLDSCHKLLILRHYITNVRLAIQKDSELSQEESAALRKRYPNLFTDLGLRIIASSFPNWFSNPEDAHELGERCRLATDPKHYLTPDEKELATKIQWSPEQIKCAKRLLESLQVKSFEDLLAKNTLKNEKGETYTAATSFRLADAVMTDLFHGNRIIYNNKRYKLVQNQLQEVIPPSPQENVKEYEDSFKELLAQFRDFAGTPDPEPADTFSKRLESWGKNEKKRIDAMDGSLHTALEKFSTSVASTFGVEERWRKKEEALRLRNERITYKDTIDSLNELKGDIGFSLFRFQNAKRGVITERHLWIMDHVNRFLDLIDALEKNIHNPVSGNAMLADNIASRLISLRAEKVIRDPNCTDDEYTKALMKLSDRKRTRLPKREEIKNTLKLDTLVTLGFGQKLMNKSDEEFLEILNTPQSIQAFMEQNAPKKAAPGHANPIPENRKEEVPGAIQS